ncbi:unnamed protein product [Cochlearia groenlandica]
MRGIKSFTVWFLFVTLLSQQLFASVASIRFEDVKTYYSPHDPSVSHGTPPSHGGSYTPTTPSTPSHNTPPSNCGSPPYDPTPSTPSHHTPTPTHHTPTPTHHTPTPSHTPPPCNCDTPPHHNPSPSTPSNPPSHGYYSSPPPSTPIVGTPPTPIVDPGTPIIGGSPPTPITGTCDYWRNHPTLIWGLLGWWGTIGGAFGTTSTPSGISGFDPHMNLLQALSNTRTDAIGALYREGTASWLNSMVNNKFIFTTPQVRDHFVAGLSSTKAATKQAHTFKLANEGHLKP